MSAPVGVGRIDRLRAEEFLRFCAVGGIGFAVDAGVLLAAIRLCGLDPIGGRFLSFALAVWATFELNRHWAFRHRGSRGRPAAFAQYLGVQGVGFACNLGVYASLHFALPPPYNAPLLCLVAGSGVAMLVNYAGASALVFGPG